MSTHIRYHNGIKHEFVARSRAGPSDITFVAEHFIYPPHEAPRSLGQFWLFHPDFVQMSMEEQEYLQIEKLLRRTREREARGRKGGNASGRVKGGGSWRK